MTRLPRMIRDPERQCLGKHGYRTKSYAKLVIKRMKSKRTRKLVAYRCPHCNAFHIGGES